MRTFLLIAFIVVCNVSDLWAMSKSEETEGLAYKSYLSGLLAERYGDSEEALAYYSEAKTLDVRSETLRLKLAVEYIKRGDNESAVAMLSELSTEDNVNVDAYLLLILMHSTQGNEGQASDAYIELLERLYALDKKNLKVAESLAQYNIQKNEYNKAIAIYTGVLNHHPTYEDGIYWLGFLYEEQGKRNEAIKSWEKLLLINPEHSNALNSLAYVYAEENNHLDKAEVMAKKALNQHPNSAAYLDTLGWVYYKQERFEEAKIVIEKVVEGFKDPVILEHLGDIYDKLDKPDKAKSEWQKALELAPENEQLKQKMRKFQDGQHDK